MKFVKVVVLFQLFSIGTFLYADRKHEIAKKLPEIVEITAEDLQKELAKNKNLLLINVLQKHIYKDCSILHSGNMPIEKLVSKLKLKKIPKDRLIVLYSASYECPVSTYAFRMLKNHGFTNVLVYKGGMTDWFQKKLPCKGKCRAGYLKG